MQEKNLEWQQINLNLRKGEQFSPEYLALNPKAVVPTLVHEDRVLRESSVVINYLEDVFPQPSMRPADPYARAMMNLLIKSFDEEVHPSVGILSYAIVLRHQMNELKSRQELEEHFSKIVDPMRRQRQQNTHEKGLASPSAGQALETLRKVILLLDELKASNTWLCGEQFSLADATAVPYLVRIRNIGLENLWQDRPAIATWMANAVAHVEAYNMDQPWGSAAFHKMVAGHVENEAAGIQQLLQERLK